MTFVLATLMATLVFTGCISDKHIIYLQGADSVYVVPQEIAQAFELKIQSDDQLAISVTSKDHELIAPFNNNTLIGSGGGDRSAGYSSSTANTQSGVSYFTVDRNGEISFPIFGQLKVAGKTTREVSQMIQDMLRNGTKEYAASIKDAIITTKIMSFKVTVLGDVKNPGVQTFTGERLTLLEAIGRAGDLNSSGKRAPVLIVREENGQRQTFEVDLRDQASVFQSPAYYLQQNDVVYVSPNKSVRVKGSTAYTLLGVSSTLVSMIISITSLVFTLSRR
jgi:polysaccharide export outer membrane protein